MMNDIRLQVPLSQHTAELLVQTITHVINGSATPGEVSVVLDRVCLEGREQPPERLVVRIKELWHKVVGGSRAAYDDGDPRYFSFIGELLVRYYGLASSRVARHQPLRELDAGGCSESEAVPLR